MAEQYQEEIHQFRKAREESLKKEWLVVVGLHWLKPGESSIGSAKDATIPLPAPAPAHLGTIRLKDGKAELALAEKNVFIDEKPAQKGSRYPLITDESSEPTRVRLGKINFYLIDRPSGIGVRVRDENSETLKKFKGLSWWDAAADYRVIGRWKKIDPPKTLIIPDVTGHSQEEQVNGSVVFTLKGKSLELFPTRKGNKLFFVFKDQTSGKSSYGTGRFLNAEVSEDGAVVLDFNKAYNPPCAYIHFATCPIAPSENRLALALEAGEKSPPGH